MTGIPEEYNDFLPKDCEEYKRWASHKEASTAAAKLEALEISGERPPAAAEGAPAAEGEKKEEKLNKQQVRTVAASVFGNERNSHTPQPTALSGVVIVLRPDSLCVYIICISTFRSIVPSFS